VSDQTVAEPDPGASVDSGEMPSPNQARWVLAGGTALGTSHAEGGKPCQDSAAWWSGAPGGASRITAVAVVADGAGSADLSRIGSQTAVGEVVCLTKCLAGAVEPADDSQRAFLALAAQQVAKQIAAQQAGATEDAPGRRVSEGEVEAIALVRALFAGARQAVEGAAREMGAEVGQLATTLIVALATEEALVVAEIGDGVVAVRASGAVVGPLAPQRGEFANETTFITTGEQLEEISLASFAAAEADAFGLSSDGMRLLITSNSVKGTPHTPFFEDMFSGVASGVSSAAITKYLRSADDRTGDDKALVIGVRVP
jgi:Protein phosphatase 2C